MRYLHLIIIFSIVTCAVLNGCVSSQQGLTKDDRIFIKTTPTGAMILLDNEIVGTTPVNVKLPRSEQSHYLKIVKDGYKTEEVFLEPTEENVAVQKRTMSVNSTVFFGVMGLVGGFASSAPLEGLLGGSLLGLIVGLGQEEKELSTKYEYSPEDIHFNLLPLPDK